MLAIGAPPASELLHRGEWILRLERRPKGSDHPLQVLLGPSIPKGRDHRTRKAAPLLLARHGYRHETERVDRHPRLMAIYRPGQGAVVAVREISAGAVPRERHAPPTRDDATLLQQQDVKPREVLLRPVDVLLGNRVMKDELRPVAMECFPALRLEVGAFAFCDDVHDIEPRALVKAV